MCEITLRLRLRAIGFLLTALDEAVVILRELGGDDPTVAHWAGWLERDRARIAAGDLAGLDHLMQAFGGMGSINDSFPADEPVVGARLGAIYRRASQLLADSRAAGDYPPRHIGPASDKDGGWVAA